MLRDSHPGNQSTWKGVCSEGRLVVPELGYIAAVADMRRQQLDEAAG